MVFSDEQKNIIIQCSELCVIELNRIATKITARNDGFIEKQGNKHDVMQKDLTKLTDRELQTKIITLNKLRCEIINVESSLTFEIQKIDKEIMRRQ